MLQVKKRLIVSYLAPVSLMLLTVGIAPIVYTIYLSFTNYGGLFHQTDYDFIGLKNYAYFLGKVGTNSDFYYVLGITILYVISCVSLFLIIGFVTAMALNNRKIVALPVWRGMLILPWAVPNLVSSLIWLFLLGDTFGPINQIIRALHLGGGINWLDYNVTAFIAVVMVNVWMSYPFFTVLILGALQSVPAELGEAASVDGANAWQRFYKITLPLLVPAIIPATILSSITTFQMFNTVFLITGGGPGITPLHPGVTDFVMIYAYNQIFGTTLPLYGRLAAFSVIIFFILLAMTISVFRSSNVTKGA